MDVFYLKFSDTTNNHGCIYAGTFSQLLAGVPGASLNAVGAISPLVNTNVDTFDKLVYGLTGNGYKEIVPWFGSYKESTEEEFLNGPNNGFKTVNYITGEIRERNC